MSCGVDIWGYLTSPQGFQAKNPLPFKQKVSEHCQAHVLLEASCWGTSVPGEGVQVAEGEGTW